jgi:hypothetical protein
LESNVTSSLEFVHAVIAAGDSWLADPLGDVLVEAEGFDI